MHMLSFYKHISGYSTPAFDLVLKRRLKQGKEDKNRLHERKGQSTLTRPDKTIAWVHAASVGESQSALILISKILTQYPNIFILVTTGTTTSAELMSKKLPDNAVHQYYPLDNPKWIENFLSHWKPDLALWMESELWPNMITALKEKNIPSVLVNARLSERSYKRWAYFPDSIQELLSSFNMILCQTHQDEIYYKKLGAKNTKTTDNIKYSASVLDVDDRDYQNLKLAIKDRPIWVYASTHDGEEELACRLHKQLKEKHPNVLTIIAPRHPHRGNSVYDICESMELDALTRSKLKRMPDNDTDVYVVDTMGELGLFYKLTNIACVGRSFSKDGGGGHNPIEPAQLDCAVLCGPNVQNLQDIYDDMVSKQACTQVKDETEFLQELTKLFDDPKYHQEKIENAKDFAKHKSHVINTIMENLEPLIENTAKKA